MSSMKENHQRNPWTYKRTTCCFQKESNKTWKTTGNRMHRCYMRSQLNRMINANSSVDESLDSIYDASFNSSVTVVATRRQKDTLDPWLGPLDCDTGSKYKPASHLSAQEYSGMQSCVQEGFVIRSYKHKTRKMNINHLY